MVLWHSVFIPEMKKFKAPVCVCVCVFVCVCVCVCLFSCVVMSKSSAKLTNITSTRGTNKHLPSRISPFLQSVRWVSELLVNSSCSSGFLRDN